MRNCGMRRMIFVCYTCYWYCPVNMLPKLSYAVPAPPWWPAMIENQIWSCVKIALLFPTEHVEHVDPRLTGGRSSCQVSTIVVLPLTWPHSCGCGSCGGRSIAPVGGVAGGAGAGGAGGGHTGVARILIICRLRWGGRARGLAYTATPSYQPLAGGTIGGYWTGCGVVAVLTRVHILPARLEAVVKT